MEYRYHVEEHTSVGNIEHVNIQKFDTFRCAYNMWDMLVDLNSHNSNADSWEVTIYDMESVLIVLSISDTDFAE